jgi:ParB/RepB/Spo0J family partition protein
MTTTTPKKPRPLASVKAVAPTVTDTIPGLPDDATYAEILLDEIHPDPDNRPTDLKDPEFDELVESIRAVGVLQPILCRPLGPQPDGKYAYQLIAGERRFRASIAAGKETIPTIVRTMDDAAAAIAQAVENLRRRDLTPSQEIRAIARCATLGVTVDDLATRLGATPSWVRSRIRLIELPAHFHTALDTGDITWDDIKKASALPADALDAIAQPTHWAIDSAARRVRSLKDLDKKRIALEKRGITVLSSKSGSTVRSIFGYGFSGFDKHAAEPCHRVYLAFNGSYVEDEERCIDPTRHEVGGESKLRRPKDRQVAVNPATAIRQARVASLLEWATSWIGSYTINWDDQEMLFDRQIDGISHSADAMVAALRILKVERPQTMYKSVANKRTKLHELAITRTASEVCLALFLASVTHQYYGGDEPFTYAATKGWQDPHPPKAKEIPSGDERRANDADHVAGDDQDDEAGEDEVA